MKKQLYLGIILFVFSNMALAHPGHGGGFLLGFMHPFTGIDHLLVMLAVGLWAGRLGGSARWQLPLTFVGLMAIGAVMGLSGLNVPYLETVIATSVMAMGLLLGIHVHMNRAVQFSLTVVFALAHGLAHGSELSVSGGLSTISGMLLATASLHLVGLIASSSLKNRRVIAYKVVGSAMAVVGFLLLGTIPA